MGVALGALPFVLQAVEMSRGRVALPIEVFGLRVAGYSARALLVADLVTGPLMVLFVILGALLCRVFRLGTRAVAALAVLLGANA
ncbi:hypothetical protein MPTA5024_02460 [Microbispora sp. ATCC PTA-5024]|nr:hypothetical protein MPTA5024_02460 [Microbispora sp. ATCC PTA-5024]